MIKLETLRTNSIYSKYDYLFTKSEYAKVEAKILKEMKGSTSNNLDLEFSNRVDIYSYEYLKKLVRNKTEFLKVVTKFINKNLLLKNDYRSCLGEIKKLGDFLSKLESDLEPDILFDIINTNKIVNELLGVIVKENMSLILSAKLEDSIKDEMLLSLIEIYCAKNEININAGLNLDDKLDNSSLHIYLSDIRMPLLTEEEEKALFVRAHNNDLEARNILVERNLRLVVMVAKRYANKKIELEDLIQEGNIGLFKAIAKYDYNLNYKFSTYATFWIRQAIINAIHNKFQTIRVPIQTKEKYAKFMNVYQELKKTLDREPTEEEMARETKLSISTVRLLFNLKDSDFNIISLNETTFDGEEKELGATLADTQFNLEDTVDMVDLHHNIMRLFSRCNLTDDEKKVIILRYGLLDGDKKDLIYIANVLGVSRERVRQIETKVLRKIVNSAYIKEFAIYMDKPEEALENIQKIREYYYQAGPRCFSKVTSKKIKDGKKVANMQKSFKTIYELLEEYSKEDINQVLSELSPQEKELLALRYGLDLEHPVRTSGWNGAASNNFYRHLLPVIRKKLKDRNTKISDKLNMLCISDLLKYLDIKEIVIIYLKYQKSLSNNDIANFLNINADLIEDTLRKLNLVFSSKIDNSIDSNLTLEEFVIVVLALGYIDNKKYSGTEIKEILGIDIKVTKEVLSKYKEELSKLDKTIKLKLDKDSK